VDMYRAKMRAQWEPAAFLASILIAANGGKQFTPGELNPYEESPQRSLREPTPGEKKRAFKDLAKQLNR
jgi:hypothetical protein